MFLNKVYHQEIQDVLRKKTSIYIKNMSLPIL